MKRNKKVFKYLLSQAIITLAFLCACASLKKDIHIDSPKDKMEADLSKLEKMIVPLEAKGGSEARRMEAEMSAARQTISGMEKDAAVDADYSSRLSAWSGRLAILEGRYSDAVRIYRQSLSSSPWNITVAILGIRLEGDPAKRLELVERELLLSNPQTGGFGELQIEKARSLLELGRFSEAAGAFDAAFAAGLDAVYRESYQRDRDKAWELRGADGLTGSLEILERGGLTWKDSISLAKNETRLLRFLSAGRDMSETELFNILLDRSFIPYTQDISLHEWPRTKPRLDDPVFRSGAAWFIWRLYAESRADRGLLSRYSSRYAAGSSPRSPIADLPPLSPFFDSILGCVETEFLSLPDGRNFMPKLQIRAAELLAVLRKIDN